MASGLKAHRGTGGCCCAHATNWEVSPHSTQYFVAHVEAFVAHVKHLTNSMLPVPTELHMVFKEANDVDLPAQTSTGNLTTNAITQSLNLRCWACSA